MIITEKHKTTTKGKLNMKTKTIPQERYIVTQITRQDAIDKLQSHHLKRNPQISYAFGMYDKSRNKQLVSVVTFGSPASPSITKGICGADERMNVIELNRLWVDSSVSNDAVMYFLQTAVNRVDKDIIVSYVQPEHDRVSRLYKGLGFLYLGLTTAHRDPLPTGSLEHKHNRHAHYELSKSNMVHRPRKHRFVMFNVTGQREVDLVKKLKYDVLSY